MTLQMPPLDNIYDVTASSSTKHGVTPSWVRGHDLKELA
jgi:hypothetical protein